MDGCLEAAGIQERFRRASWVLVLLCLGGVGLLMVVGLVVGPADLSWRDVFSVLFAPNGDDLTLTQIVWDIRLPRVLSGVVVGGGLAVAGSTLQAAMRNPLADPYILGISSGASVGAVLALVLASAVGAGTAPDALFDHWYGTLTSASLAFFSALGSSWLVYVLAARRGRPTPVRLLLSGVAFSSFASALTAFLLYLVPEASAVRGVYFWLMGGFAAIDWNSFWWMSAVVVPSCVCLFALARVQNLLLLGDEGALSLGLDVAKARRWLLIIAAFLTAGIVSHVGAIGFVGLIVPHALRPILGPDHRRLQPFAFLFGAMLLVLVDILARVILSPRELPVGVLTGLIGAPFFLFLLGRDWRR